MVIDGKPNEGGSTKVERRLCHGDGKPNEGGSLLSDIYIGTAGYSYQHWKNNVFYPKGLNKSCGGELRYYSGIFPVVEINATFHAIPKAETFHNWDRCAKPGFKFAFKVPQSITHDYRLEGLLSATSSITSNTALSQSAACWRLFMDRIYGDIINFSPTRVGPILFQLPPSLSKDITKIVQISELIHQQQIKLGQQLQKQQQDQQDNSSCNKEAALNNKIMVAFEFRNKSWYCKDVYETMRMHNLGLCENISPDHSYSYDHTTQQQQQQQQQQQHDPSAAVKKNKDTNNNKSIDDERVTASCWHYIRFHKQTNNRLETNYTDEQLLKVATVLANRRRRNIVQYCFFLNDHYGNGPRNAKTLMKLVKELSFSYVSNTATDADSNTDLNINNELQYPNNTHFVTNWKPDPVAPSIKSLFQRKLDKTAVNGDKANTVSSIMSSSPLKRSSSITAADVIKNSNKKSKHNVNTSPAGIIMKPISSLFSIDNNCDNYSNNNSINNSNNKRRKLIDDDGSNIHDNRCIETKINKSSHKKKKNSRKTIRPNSITNFFSPKKEVVDES